MTVWECGCGRTIRASNVARWHHERGRAHITWLEQHGNIELAASLRRSIVEARLQGVERTPLLENRTANTVCPECRQRRPVGHFVPMQWQGNQDVLTDVCVTCTERLRHEWAHKVTAFFHASGGNAA